MSRSIAAQGVRSLERIAVFSGLPPNTLEQIEKCCGWRRFEPGEAIIEYLDSSDDVFFIVEGKARVSIYSVLGKAVSFCDLAAGDMFGEYAAIDGAPRSASIESLSRCHVASMSGKNFRGLLQSEPALTRALLGHVVKKVRTLTARVFEFSALAVSNRIQAEVLRLANLGHREGKSARIDSAPTHAEIASRTSTHREAVTRELSRLSRIGLIERRGHVLLVKDVDRLLEMVREVTGE